MAENESLGLVIRVTEDVSSAIASLEQLQAANIATFQVLSRSAEEAYIQIGARTQEQLQGIVAGVFGANAQIVDNYAATAAKINEIQSASYAKQYADIAALQAEQQATLLATHDGFLAAEAAKLSTIERMEEGRLSVTQGAAASRAKVEQAERDALLAQQAQVLKNAEDAEQARLKAVQEMEQSRAKVEVESATKRSAVERAEYDALLAQQAAVMKEAETANAQRLAAVQKMEQSSLKVTQEATAAREATRAAETVAFNKSLLASGGVIQTLEDRLKKAGAAAAAASGLGSAEFTKWIGISRTLANSVDHSAASALNVGVAFNRAAGALGLSGAAAEKAIKATTEYSEAQKALEVIKAAARTNTLKAVEAEALYATALQKVVAVEKVAAGSTSSLGQALAFLGNHWVAIAVGAAAVGGSFIYAGEKAAKFQQDTERLHRATGLAANTIAGMHLVAMKQGLDWDMLSNGIVRYASRLGQTPEAHNRFNAALTSSGIKGREVNSAFDQIVHTLGNYDKSAQSAAYHTDIFSRVAGKQEIQTTQAFKAVEKLYGGMANLRKEVDALEIVSQKGAVSGEALLNMQRELGAQFQILTLQIGARMIPVLEYMVAALINVGKWWQVLKDVLFGTNPVLAAVVDGFHLIVGAGHLVAKVAEYVWNAFKTHFPNVARVVGEVITWIGEKISWVFGKIGDFIGKFGDWAKAHDAYMPKIITSWANLGKDIAAAGQATSTTVSSFEKWAALLGTGKVVPPDMEGPTKKTHEYNDALAQMLKRHQDIVQELQTGELPARQKISLAMDNGLREAIKEIESSRQLAAQHKISRDEMAKREQEFAQLRTVLFQQWQLQMNQEMTKEHEEAQKYVQNLTAKTKADQDYVKELGENGLSKIRAREAAEEALIHRESEEIIQKLRLTQADRDYAAVVEATTQRIQAARAKAAADASADAQKIIDEFHKQRDADEVFTEAFGKNEIQKIVANTAREESRIRHQAQEEADLLRLMGLWQKAAAVITAAEERIRVMWEKASKEVKVSHEEQEHRRLEQSYRHLAGVQGAAMRMMESNGKRSGRELINVFRQLNDAIQHHKEMTKEDMAAVAVASAAALVAFAGHQKAAAAIMVVWETAEGIRKIAEHKYHDAAMHFLSAAEYGVIAGTKSDSSATSSSSGTGGGTQPDVAQKSISDLSKAQQAGLAPGTLSSARQQQPLTVLVMGESSAAQYLTKVINKGVQHQDMRLVASHVQRPAPANSR